MFGAKSGVWWRKAVFEVNNGYNGGVWGIMGVFGVQMGFFRANKCVGGEKRCQGTFGCLGSKRGVLKCLRVKGVFGGVKGCRRHNWVFGVQMRCCPWGERGVWWVKRGVGAKRDVWWRKAVFGGIKGCLGYIYIFFNKSPWEGQSRSRVSRRVPFDKYNLMPSPMAHIRFFIKV